jgi:helicase
MDGLATRKGIIPFPFFAPVTTFSEEFPLDQLIQPYLRRLAPCCLVSYHYARTLTTNPLGIPLLVDSGGFASLFDRAVVEERRSLGVIRTPQLGGDDELITPSLVLERQELLADVAFTLDFPIPPSMEEEEARRRQTLTINNAHWALENRRRRDLPLYACVQGWDTASYLSCALAYKETPFEGLAIGGLVARSHDPTFILEVVREVRAATDLPLHVLGMGHPTLIRQLYNLGVNSTDSSSYVRYAASGRLISRPTFHLEDATPLERLHLAISNLAYTTGYPLPFASIPLNARMNSSERSVS